MTQPLNYNAVAPEVVRPLYESGKLLAASGLEPNLLTFVEMRASQINGCAFCLALHTREAESLGEKGDRLSGLVTWREVPWYTERERAALEWTEALTGISSSRPEDGLRDKMLEQFSERELVYLTLAVVTINSWNRYNVAFKTPADQAEAVFHQLHRTSVTASA